MFKRNISIANPNKNNCCGCSACAAVCPKDCIVMTPDTEGFLYPLVDSVKCIDCGLCEKVCHEIHPYDEHIPIKVYAAMNNDVEIRTSSSSGGLFYAFAQKAIQQGGVVFGARFDKNWQVIIDYARTLHEAKAFMGSKYVQARIENSYLNAKKMLDEGTFVLFSGTPCQIAGLKHYLRKDYEKLVTVDFICHGTPSPKVWRKYLDEVLKGGKEARKIEFRNKKNGWKRFNFHICYNEDSKSVSILSKFDEDIYMKGFLSDLTLRPSCYSCKSKSGRSSSDITIADFWGIESIHPNIDDDKGTGLVFLNTAKGIDFFDSIEQINSFKSDFQTATMYNPAYYRSVSPHSKREFFFGELDRCQSVSALIEKSLKYSLIRRIRIKLGWYKSLLKKKISEVLLGGGKSEKKRIIKIEYHNQTNLPDNPKILAINFRNKSFGWKNYHIEIKVIK